MPEKDKTKFELAMDGLNNQFDSIRGEIDSIKTSVNKQPENTLFAEAAENKIDDLTLKVDGLQDSILNLVPKKADFEKLPFGKQLWTFLFEQV